MRLARNVVTPGVRICACAGLFSRRHFRLREQASCLGCRRAFLFLRHNHFIPDVRDTPKFGHRRARTGWNEPADDDVFLQAFQVYRLCR